MDASGRSDGRPLSSNPDAVRKREARQASRKTSSTTSGGRGGGEPSTKGNPISPSSWSTMGEPLSPHEAERQLLYAHVGLAKVMRSKVDFDELKEEFEVAGENYAFVANKMWPPLRVMIRFVAPVVLVAVLLVIWGAMIAETPWIHNLRQWWERRGEREVSDVQQPAPDVAAPPPRPTVVHSEAPAPRPESVQQPPPLPRRPAVVRNLRGVHR